MPRQNDGKFTRYNNTNYEELDAQDAPFTGKLLNDDIEDLRVGIEDCIDGKGRGKVQADIDFNGNRITNLGNAIEYNDAVNLQQLINFFFEDTLLQDYGSSEEKTEVKLFIGKDIKFEKGFNFRFKAPFTQTKENIEKNKRREVFILTSLIDEITLPVLREEIKSFDTDYYPSFLKDDTYTYFIDEYEGKLYVRWKDPYGIPSSQLLLGNYNGNLYKDYPICPAGFLRITKNVNDNNDYNLDFITILTKLWKKATSNSNDNKFVNLPKVFIRY